MQNLKPHQTLALFNKGHHYNRDCFFLRNKVFGHQEISFWLTLNLIESFFLAGIYFFELNKANTRTVCEIFSKSPITKSVKSMTSNEVSDSVLVYLLLTLNIFHTFWCFHWSFWTSKYRLGERKLWLEPDFRFVQQMFIKKIKSLLKPYHC